MGNVTTAIMLAAICFLFLFGMIAIIRKQKEYGYILCSFAVFMVMMCILQSLSALGLPELMQQYRVCIFFCYSMGAVWALNTDAVVFLLADLLKKKQILEIGSALMIMTAVFVSIHRIRTALRHRRQPMGAETKTPMYHAGQLKIDFDKRRVFLGEEEIRLTQIEYKLVSLLAENAGKVITYESIIKDIWGPHADTNNRILRVNMANIRRKIEKNPAVPKYVFTEVGVGYRMLENELNS